MSLNIGLFTSLRVNIGDEFIREGIRAILDAVGVSYHPLYVNKVDQASLFHPEEDEVVVVADKYWDSDLFIQAGAPVYWNLLNGRSSSLNCEWYQWAWQERFLNEKRDDHPWFMNIGAGSCQPWGRNGGEFIQSEECVRFAKKVAERSLLTTVRDPVAAEILNALSIPHRELPCPAFLAAERHLPARPHGDVIGVNFMPLGSHFDLTADFNEEKWLAFCVQTVNRLRRTGNIVFVCHDLKEREFISSFASRNDVVFYSPSWRDYLDIYSACDVVLANRVHGAVCAAGFGVPSIILGNDTRAQIGDYIGLSRHQSGKVEVSTIITEIKTLRENRNDASERLIQKRTATLEQYVNIIRPIMTERASRKVSVVLDERRPKQQEITQRVSLGSVTELQSAPYRAFMSRLNSFAEKIKLRQFTDWTKVWEYPWTWFNGLNQIDWDGLNVLDVGSEISPMPWFLASLGAAVTLIERDDQWVDIWDQARRETGLKVNWHVVPGEILPLEAGKIDVVTSYSVVEHQQDKVSAINEVVRVLKPGGLFALSFDICEPELGMAYPEWNGRALTTKEFEVLIWNHPAFGHDHASIRWNYDECKAFIAWHLQSAPHHRYTVGAALLNKIRHERT